MKAETKKKIILAIAAYTPLLIAAVFWVIVCSMESQIPTGDQNLIKIQTYYIIPAILLTATHLGVIFRIYDTDIGVRTIIGLAVLAVVTLSTIPDIQQSRYKNNQKNINNIIINFTEDDNKVDLEKVTEFKKIENIEALLITLNQKVANTDCNNISLGEVKALLQLNKNKDKFVYNNQSQQIYAKPNLREIKDRQKAEKEKIKNAKRCEQIKAEIKTLNPQI